MMLQMPNMMRLQGWMGGSEIGLVVLLLGRNTIVEWRRKLGRRSIMTRHLRRHWVGGMVAGVARRAGLMVVVRGKKLGGGVKPHHLLVMLLLLLHSTTSISSLPTPSSSATSWRHTSISLSTAPREHRLRHRRRGGHRGDIVARSRVQPRRLLQPIALRKAAWQLLMLGLRVRQCALRNSVHVRILTHITASSTGTRVSHMLLMLLVLRMLLHVHRRFRREVRLLLSGHTQRRWRDGAEFTAWFFIRKRHHHGSQVRHPSCTTAILH
mmetsp:Transcript_35918/g.67013  ORF Transcript_35918/g.67013 Transcript_35918/m.67013 type:complete len:267 (-) Transcript_35918:828-1628(-)